MCHLIKKGLVFLLKLQTAKGLSKNDVTKEWECRIFLKKDDGGGEEAGGGRSHTEKSRIFTRGEETTPSIVS